MNTARAHTASSVIRLKAFAVIIVVVLVMGARTTGALRQLAADADGGLSPKDATGTPATSADKLAQLNGSTAGNNAVAPVSPPGQQPSVVATSPPLATTGGSPATVPAGGGASGTSPSPAPTPTPAPTTTPSPPPAPPVSPPASPFRDGTYSADGYYERPGGTEKIGITLTISGGVVTSTSAVRKAVDATSRQYQDDFIAHYQPSVVGKNIKDLNLGKISGGSLTPNGFNDAAANIRGQAS